MACDVDIHERYVGLSARGVLSADDIIQALGELRDGEKDLSGRPRIVNLSDCFFPVFYQSDFHTIGEEIKKHPLPDRVAVVGDSDLAFGMANMYIGRLGLAYENGGSQIRAFRDEMSALEWLIHRSTPQQ